MTDALVHQEQPGTSPALGGGHLFGFVASVVSGCVLFVANRKFTFGADEPLISAALVIFALLPHVLFVVISSVRESDLSSHKLSLTSYGRLSAVWMVTLLVYAVAQMTTLSRWIDEPIYNALDPTLPAFELLAVIYATASLAIISAINVVRSKDERNKTPSQRSKESKERVELLSGYAISIPLFFILVLWLPATF